MDVQWIRRANVTEIACLVACADNGPVGPSQLDQAVWVPGPYVLATTVYVECSGRVEGTEVTTWVTLSREGTAWILRSQSANDGDVELRLIEGSTRGLGVIETSGTVNGTALDRDQSTAVRRSMTLGGPGQAVVTLTGTIGTVRVPDGTVAFGFGQGQIDVTTETRLGTCGQVLWRVRQP